MKPRKTIFVTGGPGSTLGRRLLQKLSLEHQVGATWLHEPQTITEREGFPDVRLYRLDVTMPDAVEAVVEQVERELGEIDVLINNAGIFLGRALPLTIFAEWQQVLDVNLTGVFNTCKSVSRRMMRRKHGTIINMASLKGVIGGAGESAYSASKAGVIALTRSLARELAAYNIAVHAVCPGYIESGLSGSNPGITAREQDLALMDISHNLDDAVNFITFLCGDHLKSVTGQVFHTDSRVV